MFGILPNIKTIIPALQFWKCLNVHCYLNNYSDFMGNKKQKKTRKYSSEIIDKEKDVETMDIYQDDQRNEMLKTDEITAAENAFMQGREMKSEEIKKTKKVIHDYSVSVELVKHEYDED
jgi:hypothetical protein